MSPVGEILLSSTTRFTAQCADPDAAPALGSFVVVDSPPGSAVAVVAEVRAASADPNRRPFAYGLDPDELYRQQPQLRDLLTTEFDALLIGHDQGGGWRQLLPPQPPRLHHLVYAAPPDVVRAVAEGGDWLRTLAAAEAADDVLAAAVRASLAALDPGSVRETLIATGRTLARLLGDDYDRLQALLRRIQR
ncbi:MAG: hypothetical protein HYU66_06940 [Armatimonadetes bacterium]|nr:hypothetical protein [Armatimonadota bacterium]